MKETIAEVWFITGCLLLIPSTWVGAHYPFNWLTYAVKVVIGLCFILASIWLDRKGK